MFPFGDARQLFGGHPQCGAYTAFRDSDKEPASSPDFSVSESCTHGHSRSLFVYAFVFGVYAPFNIEIRRIKRREKGLSQVKKMPASQRRDRRALRDDENG